MDIYEENVYLFVGGDGQWDEVSTNPVTHHTHWEDFESEIKPRFSRTVEKDQRRRILKRDGGICQRCGSDEDLEIDHIHPVSLGGSDNDENLQALCRLCNREKGPKPWSVRRGHQEAENHPVSANAGGAFPQLEIGSAAA